MNNKPLTRHQRNRLRTRQQLHQALLELILEKGYDSVSIQDITDRADLARATFYLHVKDKDELLWSAIEEVIHVTEQQVHEQYKGLVPPQAEFYGYWNIFEHAQRYQNIYRVILGNKGSAVMARRVQDYLVRETLQDIERLNIYADFSQPPEITAQIVVGSILNLVIWWLETPNEYSTRQMAEMLYEGLHCKKPPSAA